MRISLSATNPCHVFDLAVELHRLGELGRYYSGYPRWRLAAGRELAGDFPVASHSWRTVLVYGLLRLPGWARPAPRSLFLWQDRAFDRWVGRALGRCDFVHAMPGQCLETFRAARRLGVRTVLNHATGPVREWIRIMGPEYARVGLDVARVSPYDEAYLAREAEEYGMADWHCVASTVVRDQLVATGVDAGRIWVVPYGADGRVFHAEGAERAGAGLRIVFAGQFGLRKGVRALIEALERAGRADWSLEVFGSVLPEARGDMDRYRGKSPVRFHGAVGQERLAEEFRRGSVLVLPSLEEGFGLVVPQALSCGLPCVVSDRVGAKDLVRHRENGSVFAVDDIENMIDELKWWEAHPAVLDERHGWEAPARRLAELSREAVLAGEASR